MTLILSNDDVEALLTMPECVTALEEAYVELVEGRGGNRLRSDIITPTAHREGLYALKSMDGVVPKFGIGAVRINSDILTWPDDGSGMRRVKVPAAPNDRYVGLVLLFSTANGEPLVICPDGVMQRMRVGATNAIAAKYMARADSRTATIIGSGWQAGAQLMGLDAVFDLDDIRCFSPSEGNRRAFAIEWSEKLDKEVRPMESGAAACRGSDIVACATNAVKPVFYKEWIEPGMHIGTIRPAATEIEPAAMAAVDVFALLDHDDTPIIIYTNGVRAGEERIGAGMGMEKDEFHDSMASLPQIMTGRAAGRASDGQVTCFLNNLGLGYQFAAAGSVLYRKAVDSGAGHELPTDWFTETVHP